MARHSQAQMHARIGIVHPFATFDSTPCLYNTALLLGRAGYRVDVFTLTDRLYVPPSFPSGSNVQMVPLWAHQPDAVQGLGRWLPMPFYWRLDLLRRHARLPYRCLIGVDPKGLLTAQVMANLIRVPLVYYSLELLLSYELASEQDRQMKQQELLAARAAAFSVIQDPERAALLIKDNELDPDSVLCMPNAPLGPARIKRSNYLRRRFAIGDDRRIILHTGNLGAHMCSHQLVHSTRDWPDDWVLICHTRLRYAENERNYLAALRYLAHSERVIFSTEPVPLAEYEDLVASADVGIAFYCPTPGSNLWGDNIRHIGLSSGKYAACLAAGVPVLVNDIASLRRLTEAYGCGAWTADAAQTRPGIEHILANYEARCTGAITCFTQEMDAAAAFGAILKRLDALPE